MRQRSAKIYFVLLIVGLFTFFVGMQIGSTQKPASEKLTPQEANTLGPVEEIRINALDYATPSRVDTGARSSSLHAEELYIYTRDGEEYIEFITLDEAGNQYKINKKVQNLIKVTNTTGIPEKRYVIREKIELNGREFQVNINLKDRSNMKYKFLMGRDLIKKGDFLVDVREEVQPD